MIKALSPLDTAYPFSLIHQYKQRQSQWNDVQEEEKTESRLSSALEQCAAVAVTKYLMG